MIEWDATDSAVVLKVATPPLRVPLPITDVPSRKLTGPPGEAMPGPTTVVETWAVNVTDWL